jgi:hypothetical protein
MRVKKPNKVGRPSGKSQAQMLAEDVEIWRLFTRPDFTSFYKLAEEVGLSHEGARKRVNKIARRLWDQQAETTIRIRAGQLIQLEEVCAQAWDAWIKSRQQGKRFHKSKWRKLGPKLELLARDPNDPDKDWNSVSENLHVWDQQGDPRYLEVYLKAKADIRRIVGADAPVELNIREQSITALLAKTYEDENHKVSKQDASQQLGQTDESGNGQGDLGRIN